MRLSISVDVPDIDQGVAFYRDVFGFVEISRPLPTMANIRADEAALLLLEKPGGSLPFPGAAQSRDYTPHWTPVHLDFHVKDVEAVRDRAVAAGAHLETWWEVPGRPKAGFFRDPFGHGFCLIGERS